MAQSVEHHLGKVEVPGSNPGNSSKAQALLSTQGGFLVPFSGVFGVVTLFSCRFLRFYAHFEKSVVVGINLKPHNQ